MEISGYQIQEKISESSRSLVFHGIDLQTGEPAVLKLPAGKDPLPMNLERVRHEYEIYRLFDHNKILAPVCLKEHNQSPVLVLEYFDGVSLDRETGRGARDLLWFLDIAIQLVDGLRAVHNQQIIYKNFSPANILYRQVTGRIKLIDFSLATHINSFINSSPAVLLEKDMVFYISPEQTGRIERHLDYRSDFYSLGATLYHLLTGSPPFSTDDPVELVHHHLAGTIVPPHELDSAIPPSMSAIIAKLLAKSADDRYHSCDGLNADLTRCLIELKATSTIVDFAVGRNDYSHFTMPQSFWGRDAEVKAILTAYERTRTGAAQAYLITGEAGIGKTALAEKALGVIEAGGDLAIRAKGGATSDAPFATIISGIHNLIHKILLSSDWEIQQWKELFLGALGDQIGTLATAVPELEFLTGPQPQTGHQPDDPGMDLYKQALKRLLKGCSAAAPVFFIDDLHLVDADTLDLINEMTASGPPPGLLICCYLENQANYLDSFLPPMFANMVTKTVMHLAPLTSEDIAHLVSENFLVAEEDEPEIARLFLEKTAGNPFFIKQLLRELHKSCRLGVDHNSTKWIIEADQLRTTKVMENVGQALTRHLHHYNDETLYLLKLAACCTAAFSATDFSALANRTKQQIGQYLAEPLADGLLIEAGKPEQLLLTVNRSGSGEPLLQFSHDQIKKAAYSLIHKEERNLLHVKIGRHLLQTLPPEARDTHIYEIVTQLNHGTSFLTREKDLTELAELNLAAARKARNASAPNLYYLYAKNAAALLPGESDWKNRYRLTLAVHTERMRAAAMNDFAGEAEALFGTIVDKAQNPLDKVEAYLIRIEACKKANLPSEVIKSCLEILAELGLNLPAYPANTAALKAMFNIKMLLLGRKVDDLKYLPQMHDPHQVAIMDLLFELVSAAFNSRRNLLPIICHCVLKNSFKFGFHRSTASMGFATYGFLLCGLPQGNINKGFAFGQLVLDLQQEQGLIPAANYLVSNLVIHWKRHLNHALEPLLATLKHCEKIGDHEGGAHCSFGYSYRLFFLGYELENLAREQERQHLTIAAFRLPGPLVRHAIFRQSVANLRGQSSDPALLDGEFYVSRKNLLIHEKTHDYTTLFIYHLMAMLHGYLFGRYELAISHGAKALAVVDHGTATIFVPLFYFYYSLSMLADYGKQNTLTRKAYVRDVDSYLRKMRLWSSHAPENFKHKYHLMTAEHCRVLQRNDGAAAHYDLAITNARQSGYLQEEGLAHECAARFYFNLGRPHLARPYLNEALHCYNRWGATALRDHLERQFAKMDEQDNLALHQGSPAPARDGPHLDIMSITKASRTFSAEIVLDELLKKLIAILVENGGAQKGYLLLEKEGSWLIKASSQIGRAEAEILSVDLEAAADDLSAAVCHYVIRSGRRVVLNNAAAKGLFVSDSYVRRNRSKSILCLPIMHQSDLVCLVYLENNLTTGAFHADRLEVLNLLASQAAISIRNSQLYEELQKTVKTLNAEIEKRKETQNQLMHADKLSALGRLSASIAHEFGNPLIGLKYLLDDLKGRIMLNTDDKRLISVGLEECDRMRSLIDDLHDLHRPSSGVKTEFDLNRMIRTVLLFQRKNLKDSGISVVTELAEDIPEVIAVEDQITQVIVNLVINAADAMADQGGVLTIRTTQLRDQVVLSISDTGTGIAEEDQERIFEPFFSTKEDMDGTGLGLAIAYSIIKRHRGDIDFVSSASVGSTFSVYLPVQPEISATEHRPREDHHPAQ